MKTTLLLPAVFLAAAFAGSTALAQDNSGAANANTQVVAASAAPVVINGLVYVAKLPTATQLTKDAEDEGLSILRIDQSADRVLVVYKYPNGSTRTFAYTTSENGTPATVVTQAAPAMSSATYTVVSAPPQAGNTVVYTTPAPTVFYTEPAPVV